MRKDHDLITLDITRRVDLPAHHSSDGDKESNNTMRVSYCRLISAGLLLLATPGFALASPKLASPKLASPKKAPSTLHSHASLKHTAGRHGRKSHTAAAHFAIPEMPAERATQIQTALIKQGYMRGEPTGTWDAQTVSAMEKLQADNGWQSKITPDSRALIKLGLGPETPAASEDQPHESTQTPPQ